MSGHRAHPHHAEHPPLSATDPSSLSSASGSGSEHRPHSHRSEWPSPPSNHHHHHHHSAHSQHGHTRDDDASERVEEPSSSSSLASSASASSTSSSASSQSQPSASGSESDHEGTSGYRKGGYHPVLVGDIYHAGRYTIERKLGWGHFSTVWLASDNSLPQSHAHHFVAIKVQKSAAQYTEAAEDEVKLLTHAALGLRRKQPIHSASAQPLPEHIGRHHVISLLHHFTIVGPHGRHMALVFECLGDNLLSLIKRYDYQGVPIRIVKLITRQVLLGLDYLHRHCGIIHTDLKPENFLLIGETYDAEQLRRERESAVRRRKDKEAGAPPGPNPTVDASAGKKLTKNQKKRMKLKAKKQAQKADADKSDQPSAVEEREIDDDEEADASSAPMTSPSLAPSAASFSSSSTSSISGALPTSSSIASTVSSSSFSSNSFASSSSFQSSSSFTAAAPPTTASAATSPALQNASASARRMSAPGISAPGLSLPPAASHLDAMLQAFSSMSLSSPQLASPLTPYPFLTKICDLGNACWLDKHFTDDVTTRQYRAPEVLVGYTYSTPIDVWSTACLVFELITGDYLFDPKEGGEGGGGYSRDEDHLALMMELLGRMPKKLTAQGEYSSDFFTRQGELRRIKELDRWGLHEVLVEKYKLDQEEAKGLTDFLLPMLHLDPDKRITAEGALKAKWLWDEVEGGRLGGKERKEEHRDGQLAQLAQHPQQPRAGRAQGNGPAAPHSAPAARSDGPAKRYEDEDEDDERYRDDLHYEDEHEEDAEDR